VCKNISLHNVYNDTLLLSNRMILPLISYVTEKDACETAYHQLIIIIEKFLLVN